MMMSAAPRARRVALPPEARVADLYPGAFLADAFAIDMPEHVAHDALTLARAALERQAPWVDGLMKVRDGVVSIFGLKTAKALRADTASAGPRTPRVGIFRIYETHDSEVVLGEDDRHLDFRLSVLLRPGGAAASREVVAVTVVHCHNLLGRNYIRLIAPFHRRVVRSALERAARDGWPVAPAAV